MLTEIAIGDAYGAGFEFLAPGPGRENDLSGYLRHPLHDMPPGSYTDDTQMTIAIAEAMIATDGQLTRRALADAFVEAFRRDQRLGYAKRFRAFLMEVRDGEEFLARMNPASERSGAAMRACPIGLYSTAGMVMDMAALQARLTHDTPRGIEAAQAAALSVHYFRFGHGPRSDLPRYLADALGAFWLDRHQGPVDEIGVNAVRAAVTAIVDSGSLSEVLVRSVDFTGDVDTVAAVAMGAASLCPDITADIPARLVRDLEDGNYGRRWIETLDGVMLGRGWSCAAPGVSPNVR